MWFLNSMSMQNWPVFRHNVNNINMHNTNTKLDKQVHTENNINTGIMGVLTCTSGLQIWRGEKLHAVIFNTWSWTRQRGQTLDLVRWARKAQPVHPATARALLFGGTQWPQATTPEIKWEGSNEKRGWFWTHFIMCKCREEGDWTTGPLHKRRLDHKTVDKKGDRATEPRQVGDRTTVPLHKRRETGTNNSYKKGDWATGQLH